MSVLEVLLRNRMLLFGVLVGAAGVVGLASHLQSYNRHFKSIEDSPRVEVLNDDEDNYGSNSIDSRVADILLSAVESLTPSHGVYSLHKKLETALYVLKIAQSVDKRLANSGSFCEFIEYAEGVERMSLQLSTEGFDSCKVVVLEGLSGTGKSTLAQALSDKLGFRLLENLPIDITETRSLLSGSRDIVLAAFDFAANYCLARAITTMASTGPKGNRVFIVENYYHSIFTRTLCASAAGDDDVAALPLSAFMWPLDLPQPSLVICLTLPTKERMKRLDMGLGASTSATERSVSRLAIRDNRLNTAYSLVQGPQTIALDASGATPEEVFNVAREACSLYNVYRQDAALASNLGNTMNRRISVGMYKAFD